MSDLKERPTAHRQAIDPEIGLTPKQDMFSYWMAATGSPKQSAIRAGYSYHDQNCQKLLKRDDIKARIQHHRGEMAQHLDVSTNALMAQLAAIATASITMCLDGEGGVLRAGDIPPWVAAAIESMDVKSTKAGAEVIRIRMHPKLPAIVKALELKGLLNSGKQSTVVNLNVDMGDQRAS